jgi:hypothetical protein
VPAKADIVILSRTASLARRQLGHDLGLGRVLRERCDDLVDAIAVLPVHCRAQLRDPGDLHREGDVPGEEDPQLGPSA